jgi:hypothetical protein
MKFMSSKLKQFVCDCLFNLSFFAKIKGNGWDDSFFQVIYGSDCNLKYDEGRFQPSVLGWMMILI